MLIESQLILRLLDTFAFLLSKAYPLCICKQMEILIHSFVRGKYVSWSDMEILIKFNILVFLEFIISLLKFSQLLGKSMYWYVKERQKISSLIIEIWETEV